MRMLNDGYWMRKEVKTHWSEFLQKKREEDEVAAQMVYVGPGEKRGVKVEGEDGVTFTSKVGKGNDDRSGWFSNKPVGPLFPPPVAAIATVTPGGKKRGARATKEEVLAALVIDPNSLDWEDEE